MNCINCASKLHTRPSEICAFFKSCRIWRDKMVGNTVFTCSFMTKLSCNKIDVSLCLWLYPGGRRSSAYKTAWGCSEKLSINGVYEYEKENIFFNSLYYLSIVVFDDCLHFQQVIASLFHQNWELFFLF